MIKVKDSEFIIQQNPEEAATKLYNKTSRKSMIQFTSTSTWVIFPERLMIGKKIEDGAIISRYRHTLKAFFPKIYAKWTIEGGDTKSKLKVISKLGLVTALFGFIFLLPVIIGIIRLLMSGNIDQFVNDALLSVVLLTIGFFLTRYEINETEKLLLRVVNEGKIKEETPANKLQ